MTETYLNAPVKNCRTCAHYVPAGRGLEMLDKCALNGMKYCAGVHDMMMLSHMVGDKARPVKCEWRAKPPPPMPIPKPPKPPCKGLIQWLISLFWNRDV